MSRSNLALVFFLYGLAFFSMGMIVWLERGRGSDRRLRHALLPLAAFGLIHGIHEWQEMFQILGLLPAQETAELLWEGLRLALLAFSFLSLAAFGASLLSPNERIRRISLLLPLAMAAIWVFGLLIMRGRYTIQSGLLDMVDVWTRSPRRHDALWPGQLVGGRCFRLVWTAGSGLHAGERLTPFDGN
jgi:hypothetical protein